jgi:hypothetical protein
MEIKLNRGAPGMLPPHAPMLLMVPGAGLIAFGLLLLWNEKLLVYIVAGMFILLGSLLVLGGWRAKRMLG